MINGRNERIRTSDPLVPNEVRYQAALHSDLGGATRRSGERLIATGVVAGKGFDWLWQKRLRNGFQAPKKVAGAGPRHYGPPAGGRFTPRRNWGVAKR